MTEPLHCTCRLDFSSGVGVPAASKSLFDLLSAAEVPAPAGNRNLATIHRLRQGLDAPLAPNSCPFQFHCLGAVQPCITTGPTRIFCRPLSALRLPSPPSAFGHGWQTRPVFDLHALLGDPTWRHTCAAAAHILLFFYPQSTPKQTQPKCPTTVTTVTMIASLCTFPNATYPVTDINLYTPTIPQLMRRARDANR